MLLRMYRYWHSLVSRTPAFQRGYIPTQAIQDVYSGGSMHCNKELVISQRYSSSCIHKGTQDVNKVAVVFREAYAWVWLDLNYYEHNNKS
jgi:hypothetical protein